MRKDILLSLLAAGALPTAAFANIDVTGTTGINDATKWVNNGLGSVAASGDLLTGGSIVVSGASAGNLTFAIDGTKLPKGNYVITAAGTNFKLSVNDKETNKFAHDGASAIVVKLEGKTPTNFSITSLKLEVEVDFAGLKATLDDAKAGKTDLTAYSGAKNQGEGHNYAEGLEATYKALDARIKAVEALIAKLGGDETLDTYKDAELGLWNKPTTIEATLKTLLADIAAYNDLAKDRTTKSANWEANQAQKADVLATIEAAKKAVAKCDPNADFVEPETKALLEDEEDGFNAFCAQVEESLKDLDTDAENLTSDETATAAKTQIDALKDAYVTAWETDEADQKAYNKIQLEYLPEVLKAYSNDYDYFLGLTGKNGSEWAAKLTGIKDKAVEDLNAYTKKGANANLAAAEARKDKAIADLDQYKADTEAIVNASNAAYKTQAAKLETATTDLATLKANLDKLPTAAQWGGRAALDTEYNRIAAAIDAAKTALEAAKLEYKCPVTFEDFTVSIPALQALIDAANTGIVGDWTKNSSTLEDLLKQLKEAEAAIKAIDAKTGYSIAGKFQDSYDAIAGDIDTAKSNNDKNLKNNNNALPVDATYIQTGITNYKDLGTETAQAFADKYQAHADLTAALAALQAQVNGATILEGNGLKKETYSGKWEGYATSIKTIKDGMDAAYADKKAQALYDAVAAINVDPDGVKGAIAGDVEAFAAALTKGNMAVLAAKAAAYDADFAAADAATTYGPYLADLKALMAAPGYDAKVAALQALVADPANKAADYQKQDQPIIDLYGAMVQEVGNLVTAAKAYVKAYTDFLGSESYKNVGTLVDGLDAWLEANSNDPAKTSWKATDAYKKIGTDMKGIDTDRVADYNAKKFDKAAYDSKVTTLTTDIANFKASVLANEEAHQKQLGYAEAAIAEVLKAISDVENSGYSKTVTFQIGDEKLTLAEVVDALKKIQSEDLQDANLSVYDAYEQLKADANVNPYTDLLAKVRAYVNGVASDYARAIIEANKAIRDAALTVDGVKLADKLNKVYLAYVNLYNKVTAADENFSQYTTIYLPLLINGDTSYDFKGIEEDYGHALIQKMYEKIRTLEERTDEKVYEAAPVLSTTGYGLEKDATDKVVNDGILTPAAFDEIKADLEAAIAEVETLDKNLPVAVNDYASLYLSQKFNDAVEYILEQEDILRTALMEEDDILDVTDEARGLVGQAQHYLDTDPTQAADGTWDLHVGDLGDLKSKDVNKYIVNMKRALEDLSLIEINTLEALADYWNGLVKDANKKLDAAKERYNTASKGALPEDLTIAAAYLAQAEANIKALDLDAQNWLGGSPAGKVADVFGNGYQENVLDEELGLITPVMHNGLVPDLKSMISIAEQGADMAEAAEANNFANTTALEGFKADLKSLKDELDAMHQLIGSLGIELEKFNNIPTDLADQAYADFAASLVDEDGNDITNAAMRKDIPYYESMCRQFIADSYAAAYDEELAYITSVLLALENDFNNKYEAKAEGYELDAIDEKIAAIRNVINNLPTVYDLVDETGKPLPGAVEVPCKDNLALMTLQNLEEQLFDIAKDLKIEDTVKPNEDATVAVIPVLDAYAAKTAEDAVAKLQAAIAEFEGVLDNELLAGWRHAPVAGADDLVEEIEAIKAAYAADKSVETSQGYYKNQLDAVETEANARIAAIAAAQAAAEAELAAREASEEAYAAWKESVDNARGFLEQVMVVLKQYEKIADDIDIYEEEAGFKAALDEIKDEIDEKRAAFECEDVALAGVAAIEGSIRGLLAGATDLETSNWVDAATEAVDAADEAVNNGQHINSEALEETLQMCKDALATVHSTSDWEEASDIIETCRAIVETAEQLVDDADESAFVPGNVNGDKDGNITTADFVALVDIILGNAKTPEEGTKQFAAADLNGDGTIGVGDAVLLMRKINSKYEYLAAPSAAALGTTANVENSVELINGQLNLTNNKGVVSMLFDLKNVSESEITLAARTQGMEIMTNTLANGNVRVMLISENAIAGNEGAVLNVNGKTVVEKAVIADAFGREYVIVNHNADAIDSITGAIKNMGEKIYNAGGQLLNGIKKGLNIILNADGTSNKVVNK